MEQIAPTNPRDTVPLHQIPIIGLSRSEIAAQLALIDIPQRQLNMRANQLWNWVYVRGVRDFNVMLNISKDLRPQLAKIFSFDIPEIITEQISTDGTRKWLLRLKPQNEREQGPAVEAVYIPEPDRATLCISSQVGCTLTCSFCHTGTQKLVRNLTASEIVGQIMVAKDQIGDWPEGQAPNPVHLPEGPRKITNVVLMGMGEPLYNFDSVKDAMLIASDNEGLSLSKRRITLSTSGVVPMIPRTGEEMGIMLAISLHAVRDDVRNELVPINKKYPIADLLEACRNYPGLSNARRITFEYVMLKGINDSDEDAYELVQLLAGIPAKINLIPFNPWPGSPYECSSNNRIKKFGDIVNDAGYASPVRKPRGRDIMAACGQLKSASLKRKVTQQS